MLNRQNKTMLAGFITLVICVTAYLYLKSKTIAVLSPAGPIAAQQKNLLLLCVFLMLFVVIPVFVLTAVISIKYRASNTNARYTPDWDHHRGYETIWWTLPLLLIVGLSFITWRSSYQLDPRRPIVSSTKALHIQAVALRYKWLFLYPELNVASVNVMPVPIGTPLNIDITSDGAMNSLWIPQLGGQMYAMAGMSTKLYLQADVSGDYRGSSANISGTGFAKMHFNAHATGSGTFNKWVSDARTASTLDDTLFAELSTPQKSVGTQTFSLIDANLYDQIISNAMHTSGEGFLKNGSAVYAR